MALAWLAVLSLTGCSAVKFGYEQAPSLLYWWLDGQVDFSETQAPKAREALDRLHQWHRKRELPLYADLLSRMASLAEGAVDAEQSCQLTRDIQQRVNLLMRESIRQFAPLVAQMDARQIKHLSKQLEDKNIKWAEQWLQGASAARTQRRLDKLVERYTDFYGSLTPAQVSLLRRQLDQSLWTPEWGQQERLRQQRDLLGVLMRIEQEKPAPQDLEAALTGVWERWLQPTKETDKQRWQAWTEQACRNLAELHNTSSAEQRQRAARRLRAYEKDLRELAGRS